MEDTSVQYPGFDGISIGEIETIEKVETQQTQEEAKQESFIDSYFNLLKTEGLIEVADDFKFDGKIETFKKVQEDYYTNLKQRAAEEILNSVPEKNRLLVEAALNGEVDIENVLNAVKNQPLAVPKSESEKLIVIEKDLQAKGISDEEIEILIESYKKNKKVDSIVEKIVENTNKTIKDAAKVEAQRKEQERIERENNIKVFAENTKTHLDKTNWGPEKKKEVYDMIFSPTEKGISKTVEILNDIFEKPEELLTLAHFLSFYKDGKLDTSTYKNTTTKSVEKIQSDWEKLFKQPIASSKTDSNDVEFNVDNLRF